MNFKGDIIITDPCYICKEDSDDWAKCVRIRIADSEGNKAVEYRR